MIPPLLRPSPNAWLRLQVPDGRVLQVIVDERPSRRHKSFTVALWCAVLLWAAFIFFMSAHSGADLSGGDGLVSRIKQWLATAAATAFGSEVDVISPAAHFVEYTVFGALIFAALRWSFPEQRSLHLAIGAIIAASLYGATDELHQYFVPDRACDPVDWLIDTCGATLGAFISRVAVHSPSSDRSSAVDYL